MRVLLPQLSILLLTFAACGGRTQPYGLASTDASTDTSTDGTQPEPPPCVTDADCASDDACIVYRCMDAACVEVFRRSCDDGDPCTTDDCDPATGECQYAPSTFDLDQDGYRGPLPGYRAGAPGACGDDCDDTRAAAHPGGLETCDGVDNDCNGVIDDNSVYVPDSSEPVRLSSDDLAQSSPGGLAFDGTFYAASYQGQLDHWSNYFHGLTANGATAIAPKRIATVGSDSFSGPILWNGSVFATVWEDRRDNDYEIYFNRLDSDGDKLGPDVRVSEGLDFSLHPSFFWDGSRYVIVWDDLREGLSQIYGRLLSVDGEPLTEEIALTDPELEAENPSIVPGSTTLGMVFKYGPSDDQRIGFRTVSSDLEEVGTLVGPASERAVSPAIAASGGRFFIAWHTRSGRGPGDSIYGAVLTEDSKLVVPEKQITFDAKFARTKTWLPLGDRMLLIWGADYGEGYDLYTKMLTLDLDNAGSRVPITSTGTDSVSPMAVFGPEGDVGVLFRDSRDGPWQTFFARLRCQAGR